MKQETIDAIKALTDKAGSSKDSSDALRFSEAALNLAHAEATLEGMKHYK